MENFKVSKCQLSNFYKIINICIHTNGWHLSCLFFFFLYLVYQITIYLQKIALINLLTDRFKIILCWKLKRYHKYWPFLWRYSIASCSWRTGSKVSLLVSLICKFLYLFMNISWTDVSIIVFARNWHCILSGNHFSSLKHLPLINSWITNWFST